MIEPEGVEANRNDSAGVIASGRFRTLDPAPPSIVLVSKVRFGSRRPLLLTANDLLGESPVCLGHDAVRLPAGHARRGLVRFLDCDGVGNRGLEDAVPGVRRRISITFR